MIQMCISNEDTRTAQQQRFLHPHPRVQLRMEVLWLKSQGFPTKLISKIAGVSPNTVRDYLIMYKEAGITRLQEVSFYRPQSKLVNHRDTLECYFRDHPVASISEAIVIIEQLTGIRRSPTQVRKFLKSIGMKVRKVGTIPSKADPDEQEMFKKEQLEPRLEEAKSSNRIVLFVDAAHFVLSAYLGFLWCFERVFIKAPSGRKRFNVLGALNAISHELTTVTNDSYINAECVCDLLIQIADRYVGIPITLVLDNARYQKCALVQNLAELLNIELLYLPSYSPNLNLIERLWKFVKKKCLYSQYYQDFVTFKTAISDCLSQTHCKHRKDLSSLLTLRFQTFKKAQIMAV
jgi:transposase